MSGSVHLKEDNSLLSRIDQQLLKVELALALSGGLAVFALMLMAVFSVSSRNILSLPLSGYVDWIEQAMPIIAFMGIAYVQRHGAHIRMDMLVGALKGRVLYAVELLTTLAILLLMILLVWGSWAHFERSFDWEANMWSRDSSMDIALPIWPAKMLIPIAFSVLVLRLCVQVCGYTQALISGTAHPVAVPMVKDTETQAAEEAAQLD